MKRWLKEAAGVPSAPSIRCAYIAGVDQLAS